MQTDRNDAVSPPTPAEVRRVIYSSFIGTALEWYDFFLFGTTTAIVFAPLFFPKGNDTVALLGSFLTFGIGFAARPLGAVIFGHLGDRNGRKNTLIATLVLMGTASMLMGLLPDYATAGLAAPIMLTLLRILQGIATGGEWGGATLMALEYAPENKRGLYTSIIQMGSPAGNVLSTGMVSLMGVVSGAGFLVWGWRVPYLLSLVLIAVGLWMRMGLKETPAFANLAEQQETERAPVVEVIKTAWPQILIATFTYLYGIAGFFMMTTFGISYFAKTLGFDKQIILNAIIIGALSEFFTLWLGGRLAVKFGPGKAVVMGYVISVLVSIPFFALLTTGDFLIVSLALVLGIGLGSIPYGPAGALMSKLFPTRLNYSGLAISANLAGVISGFMPFMATAVSENSGKSPVIPTIILVAIAATSLCGAIAAERHVRLNDADNPKEALA